ncbi:hypothetical protein [Tropicimonas sediminicola]|uniref:Ca2+-binding protein, EF-hand superfamily n=1 Tax=Tropicimonas sediminicola TaxID=1031541 RepID=A0A239CMS2_9RHOB|nr:hypothetical protein [Tropicimonas sediminicola]SNS20643.1 Ca2+-binding protein, EF-hand superfamily [Tropicimonas sediminicola]
MKRTAFTAVAAALITAPAFAQQAPQQMPAPGENFLNTWDLDEDGQVTLEEIQERRAEIFAGFDGDEDGALSVEEFDVLDAARMDGMQRPEKRGQLLGRGEQPLRREALDADQDGSITAEEYAAGAEAWLRVMDGNGDGVLTIDDFGRGAARVGMGQGMGQGQGQGRGNGQGMGQGRGQGQGMGQFAGPGSGQGREMMQGQGGQRMARGDMQRDGKWRDDMGRGGRDGKGQRQADRPAAYGAFPTADGGLWIVDSRTGDILFCRSSVDSGAPAGFTPVCVEAKIQPE